LADFNTIDTIY